MTSLRNRITSALEARPWLVLAVAGLVALSTLVLGEVAAADTRARVRDAQLQAQSAAAVRAANRAGFILSDIADLLVEQTRPGAPLVLAVSAGDRRAIQSALTGAASHFTYAPNFFFVDNQGFIVAGATASATTGPLARVIGRRTNTLPWFETPHSRLGTRFMSAEDLATVRQHQVYLSDLSLSRDRAGELMAWGTAAGDTGPGEDRLGYIASMSVPVTDRSGNFAGALVADIHPAPFIDAIFELQGIATGAYLVDRRGRLIRQMVYLQAEVAGTDLSSAAAVRTILTGGKVSGEGVDPFAGGDALLTSVRVPDMPADAAVSTTGFLDVGWTIIAAHPLTQLYTDLDTGASALRAIRTALVAAILIFAALLTVALQRVVRQRTQLASANQSLEVASHQIAAAAQHKSEFLANMSHELRTPLTAIIGFSDVLGQRIFGELNPKQTEYIGDISSSGNHLLALVNEVLDLSKVEAGRVELERGTFSMAEAVSAAMTLVRERATRHDIRLAAIMPADLGSVDGDERKIRQVLLNLLSNAVKFTPDGGRVEVTVRRADDEVLVSVRDTGVGIAAEDQPRVFEEFRQVGSASGRTEGTGLGLTLAKRFIELHGGRIWLESAVGAGSTFTFAIPVGHSAAASATV